ncbi:histidine kinase [Cupriavidus basilensis]|uniref:histidine kinase n=1 Tax=Cupriavidus basilensis TaxID=68895 RepID=UPI002844BFBA|nr:histidine kinase [Cupriavidus basilensis]MDR3383792.1 histidine kinase [Cupriavidus basilensis]
MMVAALAALALMVQPILTAAWSSEAVRFMSKAAELRQRGSGFAGSNEANGEARQWLAEARALLVDPPFGSTLSEADRPGAFTTAAGALPLLEQAAVDVAESLQRHLRVDIAVRIALLIVAGGGVLVGLRLRRHAGEAWAGVAAGNAAAAQPQDRWLTLLDHVMTALSGESLSPQALRNVCGAVADSLAAQACGICLDDETSEALQLPAVVHVGVLGWAQVERARTLVVAGPHMLFEMADHGTPARPGEAGAGMAVPISDGKVRYGHLFVVFQTARECQLQGSQIGEAVGTHLALAVGSFRRMQEGRRVALIEERATMARELHDSLAQSLSYMKIQVSRLQTLSERGDAREELLSTAEELRDGLNGAYRKLRELITTFRTQINAQGLAAALEEALEEYGARSSVAMTLDNRLKHCRLTANEEFHIVQIVREALSNVVRHAGASQATVRLLPADNGAMAITIEDDGLGFEPAADARNQHGTAIMRERALSLDGALAITPRPGGGCCVAVRFRPVGQPDW